jgi:opacity protein-like surface antigen
MVGIAQEKQKIPTESGKFQLGVRTAVSAFSDAGYSGFGYGGQFRIRCSDRINTDWYGDYLTTDIGGLAKREDLHIGWSVLAYPMNCNTSQGKFTPYILAGHCFDYTKVSKNKDGLVRDRFSSAVQMGVGTHYNITDRMDVSLTAQYMMHIGKTVRTEVFTNPEGERDVYIDKVATRSVEGHLLINLSVNVLLFDMWDQRKEKKSRHA